MLCTDRTEAEVEELVERWKRYLHPRAQNFYKLDEAQRILISEVDNYPAGRRLMELYTPTQDPSMTLGIRWTLKALSTFTDTSLAMQDQGFPAVSTLAEAHMLLWDTVPARSKWSAVDESQDITQIVQRKTVTNNTQQTFADLSVEDLLQVLVRKQKSCAP